MSSIVLRCVRGVEIAFWQNRHQKEFAYGLTQLRIGGRQAISSFMTSNHHLCIVSIFMVLLSSMYVFGDAAVWAVFFYLIVLLHSPNYLPDAVSCRMSNIQICIHIFTSECYKIPSTSHLSISYNLDFDKLTSLS